MAAPVGVAPMMAVFMPSNSTMRGNPAEADEGIVQPAEHAQRVLLGHEAHSQYARPRQHREQGVDAPKRRLEERSRLAPAHLAQPRSAVQMPVAKPAVGSA